ncbi:UDP-N-acetylmuramoylalanine--D-glutamate ligase [Deltaproteobacteria bacterium]|nr:UDP-N-acetylmuramoylalanine--D-glutamate ligase [Deltaproteobacteria bacterium]
MALEKIRGQRVHAGDPAVVVGAGRSGLAAVRLLIQEGARVRLLERNAAAVSGDTRELLRAMDVEIIVGEHHPEHFEHASFVVPSPGMPISRLAEHLGREGRSTAPEVLAEMELAWRCLADEPVLAVTGTSGKTTTASLAAAMLQAQGYSVFLGGNIGTPLSEYVLSRRKADVLVLEVSSFQLQACSTFCPRVGVLLNIAENHLDYHKDMREYTETKFRLFRCQNKEDLAVLGVDLKKLAGEFNLKARQVYIRESGRFSESRLLGGHSRVNQEAAWQACRFFGVGEADAAAAVARFKPLPHRLEVLRKHNGVLYVNDSKSTTVAALRVAMQAFDQPVRLLCGGKFKGGHLQELREIVRSHVIDVAIFGASREVFEQAWQDIVPISWHENLESAVLHASSGAREGDVILLSPATSSFDLYTNYMARGDDFKRIVEGLS